MKHFPETPLKLRYLSKFIQFQVVQERVYKSNSQIVNRNSIVFFIIVTIQASLELYAVLEIKIQLKVSYIDVFDKVINPIDMYFIIELNQNRL